MSKVRTATVDRNGKHTHVWRNPDVPGGTKTTDRLGNITSQFVPMAMPESKSDFSGIILMNDGATLTTKSDDRNFYVDVPTMGALATKLREYPVEWGAPTTDTVDYINKDMKAGWRGEQFIIEHRMDGVLTLDNSEVYLLGSNLEVYLNTARAIKGWNQTFGYVDIVESPVSDRDSNYYVTLGDKGMLVTYIQDSGLADEDMNFGYNDRDQVTFFRDETTGDDSIKIQVAYNDDDFDMSNMLDQMDEDEHTNFIDDINTKLAEIDPNIVANFDSPESVEILYTTAFSGIDAESKEGSVTFTTSNALHQFSEPEHVDKINRALQVLHTANEG